MAEVIIKVFASNPPSILFALGFVLLFVGYTTQNAGLITAGWVFVVLGAIFQGLWLFVTSR